jgi:hypothetical protein
MGHSMSSVCIAGVIQVFACCAPTYIWPTELAVACFLLISTPAGLVVMLRRCCELAFLQAPSSPTRMYST